MDSLNALSRQSIRDVYAKTQNQSALGQANTAFTDLLTQQLGTKSLDDIFAQASQTYDVPLNLLKAVAKAESGFNAAAVSGSGAQGIMQLMPKTAAALGVDDPFDAEQNIMGGAKYLSQMLSRYDGDPKLALAAYNAGSGNVAKYNGIPPFPETQNYVNKVLAYAENTLSTAAQQSAIKNAPADASGFTYDDYLLFIQLIQSQIATSGLSIAGDNFSF